MIANRDNSLEHAISRRQISVALLMPWWCFGGVERYHLAMTKWTSSRIQWTGCAIASGPVLDTAVIELSRWMPVHAPRKSHPVGSSDQGVHWHETEAEAINSALQGADVVLTWGVSRLAERLAQFRGAVIPLSHGSAPWIEKLLTEVVTTPLLGCDCIEYVAVSEQAAQAFPRQVRSRVKIMPAGIELDRIAPSRQREVIRCELGLCPDEKAIGYIGRFSDEKNPLHTAEIVGRLGGRYVAVYHGTNLWGEAKFRADVKRLSNNRVRFADSAWHTGDIYSALDSLVQASPNEGGPLVALEAWISGVPLVTTPVGVIADELKQGNQWGHVVPGSAPIEDWCRAVVDSCTPAARESARRIVKHAVERYSAIALARRWEWFLSNLNLNKHTGHCERLAMNGQRH
ncbi:MAG: glycosyltransferase [Planctomycetota bacterium]